MPFAEDLAAIALEHSPRYVGAFYGPAAGLVPGTGLIFSGVSYPTFNEDLNRYEARRGLVLILTHECDIEQANEREFNHSFIAAPLILMAAFARMFEEGGRENLGRNLARDIASDKVHRMFFLPPTGELMNSDYLHLGAFIYLNALTSGHINLLRAEGVQAECALSTYALNVLDQKLKNHLFRPPAQQLPRVT
jgi:hypothetical protein